MGYSVVGGGGSAGNDARSQGSGVDGGFFEVFATAATNVAQVGTALWLIGRRADPRHGTQEQEHNTLFICPEHAQVFARAGWGRAEIQAALYRKARLPFRTLMLNKEPKALLTAHPELGWLRDHPDLPLPVVEARVRRWMATR